MIFKTKKQPSSNEEVQKLEAALITMKVTAEFFKDLGDIRMREGEEVRDMIARCLGITREAFEETHRYLRSVAARRVIAKGE